MCTNTNKFNILLGCTGSVATIKLPLIIQTLFERQSTEGLQFDVCFWVKSFSALSVHTFSSLQIKILLTESAKHFVDVKEVPSVTPILTDIDEWNAWQKRGDPVLHIDLTKWADVFVIAPLDANSLAKIAQVNVHNEI